MKKTAIQIAIEKLSEQNESLDKISHRNKFAKRASIENSYAIGMLQSLLPKEREQIEEAFDAADGWGCRTASDYYTTNYSQDKNSSDAPTT